MCYTATCPWKIDESGSVPSPLEPLHIVRPSLWSKSPGGADRGLPHDTTGRGFSHPAPGPVGELHRLYGRLQL